MANIPKRFGGELDYDIGSDIRLDPAISEILTWPSEKKSLSLPLGPIKWVRGEGGSRIAVAVGKEGEKARCDNIAVLNSRE